MGDPEAEHCHTAQDTPYDGAFPSAWSQR
jgi:hypothetical protein